MNTENLTPPTVAEMLRVTGLNTAEFMKQVAEHIDKLEQEKRDLELKLYDNLSLDEVKRHSERLGAVLTLLDQKGMRWLELSEYTD